MEIHLTNAEKSEQVAWNSDDQDLLGHTGRSYKCSFCKRGFSNAQALGGHMNIHRKDRARLKEFSSLDVNNNILSLEITKKDSPNSVDAHDSVQHDISRDEISCTPKRACTSPDQEIDPASGDHLRLTLFVETSSSSSSNNNKVERNRITYNKGEHVKRSMHLSRHESLAELDLELRLGPEPLEVSKNR
ncbi:hypothetical protein ACH5RR_005309 [Cinchona calisaya]|uniref:C2H2-type domain-containing protein n=1 Tax=Cinchona calisaya TaxID=153742 RepID=A0ABD3AKV4_9GENT